MSKILLHIDGRDVEAKDGMTILEAARSVEIHIPTLCHHPKLSPYGGCRLCIVEIKNRNKIVTSCTTTAAEGMEVITSNENIERIAMNISEQIAERKSVRAYLDKHVPSEDLKKIIEAGRWAPNAGPFQISVVRNPELRQRINDQTHEAMHNSGVEFLQQRASLPGYQPLYGAPVLILLSGPADAPHSARNTALAAENMLLEATGLGLGSCFIITPTLALKTNRDLAQEAGIPDNFTLQCAVIIGYAAAENKFTVAERIRKGSVNYVD